MMMLAANKQKLYYSLLLGEAPVYQTDSDGGVMYYTDSDGNQIPLETGETELIYSTPKEMFSSISMSGGEAEAQEYGLSVSEYNATLVCSSGEYPLTEGSLVWHKSEIESKYSEETEVAIDGKTYSTIAPIKTSSDYMVIKCSPSLTVDKYILGVILK